MSMNIRYGNIFARIILRMGWILVFILSMAYALSAQESNLREMSDSLLKKSPINQSLLFYFHIDTIYPPPWLESPYYAHEFLHQSLIDLPSSLSSQFQQQVDVVSPWKQELAKQNEFRALRTVLGTIQAGGTAYILYEHIRKYGLK